MFFYLAINDPSARTENEFEIKFVQRY